MSQKRDYYEVLGVSRDASPDEIRKAYKKSALKFHPDRNPGDAEAEAKFKEATEAFSVLSDEQKKSRYDRFGHQGLEGMGNVDFGNDIFSHFQDIFSDFFGGFGGRPKRQGPQRGADLRVIQVLTLQEAVLGCKKEINIETPVPCETCGGSGAAKGHSRQTCESCHGTGQVSNARGFVMFTTTCPACRGEGSVVTKPCETCRGIGQVDRARRVVVSFPAGIDSGQRLRVPNQGVAGPRGGPAGDLYVDVDLQSHDVFERQGDELITRVNVSFANAALGTSIQLAALDDTEIEVKIPAGTQPGDVITLTGKGVPRLNGRGRGPLHIVVQVDVPKRVSSKTRALLLELEKELQASTQSRASVG